MTSRVTDRVTTTSVIIILIKTQLLLFEFSHPGK